MIYIIITTCLINKFGIKNNVKRKERYTVCIKNALSLIETDQSFKPIIVENSGCFTQTFLNSFNCDVVYTTNNKLNFPHKGNNELLDIKEVISRYNINDNDTIIKLTGRYNLLNLNFLDLVKKTHDTYDAFVKFYNVATKQYMLDDCVLGLFAVKCKYLKEFNYKFIKSAECEFAEYVRIKINNLYEINQLDLECCFAQDLVILIV